MRNGLKKVMALMMTLMMILSLVPATVFAETTDSNTVVVNGAATKDAENPGTLENCSIEIKYVFADGSQAANSWTASIAKGSSYMRDITSPTVLGYTPNQAVVSINVTNIQQDVTYTVTYSPAEVNFTVKRYQQNVDNDQYTLVETETKKGYTENEVGANLAKTYEGFTALLYDTTTKIAADGSTVVEIYYDRNYYLMKFDLDGGYGVEPIYGRYGMPIEVGAPKKPGYTFKGWDKQIPTTMPDGHTTYTATWEAGNANLTVVFWYENANDENYSVAGTYEEKKVTVGTKKNSSDYQNQNFTGRDADHFTYNNEKNETVTVAGDDSSVLNVYFRRNTYTIKFPKVKVNGKDYTVTRKYDADITDVWKNDPIKTLLNQGYVFKSSVTGKYYSFLEKMPGRDITMTWTQWSGDTYEWYYYLEVPAGMSAPAGSTTRTDGGKNYYLYHTTTIKGTGISLTYDEDYYPITGYTQRDKKVPVFNNDRKAYLYYTRNQYSLTFRNYGAIVKEETKYYEADISGEYFEPQYPALLEVGAYEFDGWYSDPYFNTKFTFEGATMPAGPVMLYAYWKPVNHTVRTWLDAKMDEPVNIGESNIQIVAHGAFAAQPAEPTGTKYDKYTFVGWFYKDGDKEKAFDFASMSIRKDMDIYAKWSSNVMVPFTIRYTLKDGTVIATETVGSALAGTTKTFDAKAGDQLYEGYRTGYFPQTNSHSLTMDINGNNEFTFIYVPKDTVPYVVRYLEKGTGTVLHEEKTAVTSDAVITEKFVTVSGYRPDAYQKRLVLSATESENEITFWYEKDEEHAPVQIIHWTQNIAGDGYTEYQSSTNLDGLIDETYTADWLDLDGFTHNEGLSNVTGKLTAEGLVLNLYYDRIEYPYEFRFLEQGTNKVLADPVTGKARYQAQVTETAKVIPGYTLVSPENQAINIAIEDPADVANVNVRIFYYTENTVNITYVAVQPAGAGNTLSSYADNNVKAVTGTVEGSTPNPNAPTYKFVGWFKDETCTIPVDAAWVDANGKITPQKETLVEGQPAMGYKAATYYAKFELNAVTVTVRKEVTGNFGDKSKYFKITYGSGENDSIRIKNGEALELPMDVLVNSILNLTEECEGYSASAICKVGNDTIATASVVYAEAATKKNPTLTFNFSDEGKELTGDAVIIITNHKDTTPDTGVLLDSLPYILIIACVAAIGAFIVIRRRKNRED